MKNLIDLRKKFKDKTLFDQALTHRSWPNEHKNKRGSNERLEFLGDAVLDFVVTDRLYKELPDKNEGELTAIRAKIVNTKNLYQVARKIDLGKYIFISKGEEETGGRSNEYILADTVEAIIGSIYLDLGIKEAAKFINDLILLDLKEKLNEPLKDPKSTLQEITSIRKIQRPKYEVTKETGPANSKEFTVVVKIGDQVMGEGRGKSKQDAQQEAATKALEKLNPTKKD
jgi:ribonuclease-3